MKNFNKSYLFQLLIICAIAFYSCSKEEPIIADSNSPEVQIYNGMLAFESYDHLISEILIFSNLTGYEKNKWLNDFGIETYGKIFREVIRKEDSISNYLFSLPVQEQEVYLELPQIHSDFYIESINKGYIKIVQDDDNAYFDLNLADKAYAEFLNLEGKIRIGDDVLIINECEVILMVDVNYNQDIPEEARVIELPVFDRESIPLKSSDPHNWSEVKQAISYAPNWLGTNQKRVWAEIEGYSYLGTSIQGMTDWCSSTMHTTFKLKAYSQKRNFWGNFVFSGDFNPLVEMTGTWSYDYQYWNEYHSSWNTFQCGYYSYQRTTGTLLPNYYCYPNPDILCKRSPINESYYGNGWELPVAPHGILSHTIVSNLWWAGAVRMISMNITIKIDNKPFYFNRSLF